MPKISTESESKCSFSISFSIEEIQEILIKHIRDNIIYNNNGFNADTIHDASEIDVHIVREEDKIVLSGVMEDSCDETQDV